MHLPLRGKTGLIFGASSGIGRATACAFAAAGASVGVAARRSDELGELVESIRSDGGTALQTLVDTRDASLVEQGTAHIHRAFGRLDIVVYASGINLRSRALGLLSDDTWRSVLETNLTGAFYVTRTVVPLMREQGGGLLIYISSSAARRPDQSGVAYQASKAGLVGLAHGTMEEERRHGIRSSVVFPGLTDTALVAQRPTAPPPGALALALQPSDVAAACVFIAALPARAHVAELVLAPSRS
jgi:serine 3-dehydrogenase (NADP+)